MENKLVEIPSDQWPKLRDMYLKDWPKNHVGYYTIDNYCRWIQRDSKINHLNVYSLNGDWSDGTFVVVDRYQLLLNSMNPSNDRLRTALNLLDWCNGYKVSSFLERHRSAVVDVVETKQLTMVYDSLTILYYLPQAEAEKFELRHSDTFHMKPMKACDAKIADDVWPNRHQGSLFFLKRLIDWNPNIGIYTKDDELAAWCFRLQSGALGALQVMENFKRHGLGSLAVKAMAKMLAEMGHDTFALVGEQNSASRKLFEKLGFVPQDKAYWLRTDPLVKFEWADD